MSQQNRQKKSNFDLFGAIVGGLLLSLPATSLVASAQSTSPLNPCPGIYYEEPFNRTIESPEGCPSNAAAMEMGEVETTVPADLPAGNVTQPPIPETSTDAIAKVMPMEGTVDVKLTNNTNALITYQAVGHTDRRVLAGGEEALLQNLPTPITVTLVRQGSGFLKAVPISSESGMLAVSLEEEFEPLDENQGVLRIQEDGQVFLY